MEYFTADLHLNDVDIAKERGMSVEDMNMLLIRNINATCKKEDILYIVGDVGSGYVVPLLKQIQCSMYLITGNHDTKQITHKSFRECFQGISHEKTVLIEREDGEEPYHIYLNHYPLAEWDGFYRGNYLFYGHVHSAKNGGAYLMDLFPRAVNVGVDVNGYYPKTATELIETRESTYCIPTMSMKEFLLNAIFVEPDDRHRRKVDNRKYRELLKNG